MLHALEHAKKVHQEQMLKIEKLLEGKEVSSPTPLAKTECGCGEMFYDNQEEMIAILGLQLFEKLDMYHSLWHVEYAKIYKIFFKEKRGLFSKMFKSKPTSLELDKAKMYRNELVQISNDLYHVSETALRRVSALSATKFK